MFAFGRRSKSARITAESLVRRHFRPTAVEELLASSRTFPATARVDLQSAMEKVISTQFRARPIGIHVQYPRAWRRPWRSRGLSRLGGAGSGRGVVLRPPVRPSPEETRARPGSCQGTSFEEALQVTVPVVILSGAPDGRAKRRISTGPSWRPVAAATDQILRGHGFEVTLRMTAQGFVRY